MVFSFNRFGRQIFKLYECYPLTANSIVGGSVYVLGEITSQQRNNSTGMKTEHNMTNTRFIGNFKSLDWNRIGQIGALGILENGVLMLLWYNFLSTYIGCGISTGIVLIKCALDQIFFATQQDLLFLALCAYNEFENLPTAVEEVKRNFLTTWIMDCSVWPLVNFVGFAAVPMTILPTYMAGVSLFWQMYISSVACNGTVHHFDFRKEDEAKLHKIFDDIDIDKWIYIDENELKAAFKRKGVRVKTEDIQQMIRDGDEFGEADGKISFEEFKRLKLFGEKVSSAGLWSTVRNEVSLDKGGKAAMRRYEELKRTNANQKDKSESYPNLSVDITGELSKETVDAIRSASVSGLILTSLAIARKFILKI